MAPSPMQLARLLAFLLLLLLLLLLFLAGRGEARANPQDCCLSAPRQARPFPPALQRRLVAHRLQGPATGCLVEAVVFITKKRELCISPDEDWIPALVKKIDARNRKAARKGRDV